jgi:hypothetical protein
MVNNLEVLVWVLRSFRRRSGIRKNPATQRDWNSCEFRYETVSIIIWRRFTRSRNLRLPAIPAHASSCRISESLHG